VYPTRFTNLAAARGRYGDRVDRLGEYLTRVDPLADDVVRAIDAMAPGAGWDLLQRMLRAGSAAHPEAPPPLRALLAEVERIPVWVDWDAVDAGGRVLLAAGPVGGLVLGFKSLILAYTSPAGNKPLVFSGRLAEQASRRLQETARFVRETIVAGGMRPHAPGWRIAIQVRLIHAQVRRMILATGRWNAEAWGAPINQHDEAGTSLLFSSVVLEGLRQFGMRVTPAESEAYMHLWRWSGWLMGIAQDLLPATESEAARLGALMAATQAPPDDDSRALAHALIEAPLRGVRPGQRAAAARAVRVGASLCRMLVGDAVADSLGVAPPGWPYPGRWVRPVVAGVDRLRRAVPFGGDAALRMGRRYWDRVLELGLVDATAEFPLPARLAAA
jgi:hypothetical protein